MNYTNREIRRRVAERVFLSSARVRVIAILAACFLVASVAAWIPSLRNSSVEAANPAGGTVSEANPQLSWTGAIMPANPDLLNSPRCAGANASACDNFSLTVNPPAAAYGPYVVEIRLQPQGDWDMEIYNPNGNYRTGAGNGAGAAEIVTLFNPPAGTYRIAAFPFSPVVGSDGNSYAAVAKLMPQPPNGSAPGTENVKYATFACPAGQSCTTGFGEPSIGVNWKTNNVMFAGGGTLKTFRVNNFNDQVSPATATWTNVSGNQHIATTPRAAADPILFTDPVTGRTFADQLEGLTPFSTLEYTDDDGNIFIPSQGSGVVSGVDHQTIGGGPLAPPLTLDPNLPRPAYPHAVYYCAQALGPANCALSLDGGLTFGPAVPMWTTECGGLHGHLKISPKDGTVYIPNKGCGGRQGLAVSTDNGITWDIRTIPNTATGESDPSIGVATDGTVYFGFVDGDGHPKIAVSHDKGLTWDTWNTDRGTATFIDVGLPFGLENAVFAAVVAGDADRAAFTFHGSPTAGPFQDASFNGVWDLYVAHTYDGGRTWTTVKATSDPTQRGCIWLGGGTNPCRNLLDFMDATVDAQGRVLVGYADGCTGACATNPANTAKSVWATIARQSDGLGVFSAFDPKGLTEQNVNSLVALQANTAGWTGGVSSFNLSLKNTSAQTIFNPLRLEVAQISSASGQVAVSNSDNGLSASGASWNYSSLVGTDNMLTAAEVSGARSLKFRNPNNESFSVTFSVFGNLPYTGPSCCSPAGSSSSGDGGGSGGSGQNSTASSSPSISATNLVYQLTYNPLLKSVTVKLVSPQ